MERKWKTAKKKNFQYSIERAFFGALIKSFRDYFLKTFEAVKKTLESFEKISFIFREPTSTKF